MRPQSEKKVMERPGWKACVMESFENTKTVAYFKNAAFQVLQVTQFSTSAVWESLRQALCFELACKVTNETLLLIHAKNRAGPKNSFDISVGQAVF